MKKIKVKGAKARLMAQNREEVLITMYKMNKRNWLTPIEIMRKADDLAKLGVIKAESTPGDNFRHASGWRWFDFNDRAIRYIHSLVVRKMVRMFIIKRKTVYKLNKKGRDHVDHSLKNILTNVI